jgi:hypothetical protein
MIMSFWRFEEIDREMCGKQEVMPAESPIFSRKQALARALLS